MKKSEEIRGQAPEELQALLDDCRAELYALNNKKVVEKRLEKPHQKKILKRKTARVLTILNEKQKS